MIEFDNVTKTYAGSSQALNKLSFKLASGEMAFLTGHSGAGKSTLLKLIALIERADHGRVHVGGQDLSGMGRRHIPFLRRRIGLIFQDHQLLTDRTVFENVALPLIISGVDPNKVDTLVHSALATVGLSDKLKAHPDELSGGQQQRVGIARALVNRPRILLADEPTGNLDPKLSRDIMDLFVKYNRSGATVLIATHDMNLVANMGKRVITLEKGQLLQDMPGLQPGTDSLF